MASPELKLSWAISLRHLAASRYYLSEQLPSEDANNCWTMLQEYLHHNELGLALDEAEYLGVLCDAPSEFWAELLSAAEQMHRAESASRIRQKL